MPVNSPELQQHVFRLMMSKTPLTGLVTVFVVPHNESLKTGLVTAVVVTSVSRDINLCLYSIPAVSGRSSRGCAGL